VEGIHIKPQRYYRWALLILIFMGISIYFYFNNPAATLYPPCPFLYLSGYYCPGCGTSRAFHQLLHGNIINAFNLNPLMVICIPLVAYLFVCILEPKVMRKCSISRYIFNTTFLKIMFGIILVYWIARNIKFYPFILLAP
jgi:hypothetical protein